MKISEISEKTNISIHTLRYYEKEGLLLNIRRNVSGQRIFDQTDIEWLTWIKRLKSTGMPLAEIKTFAKLRLAGTNTLHDRKLLLLTHKVNLEREIERLNDELEIVRYKINAYDEKILDLE
ncbi:MerR family transcriptional regulator [Photobacterium ganghwense]|uniref:MerR family transcriptional regulator n=1 Tax=Photobacterium ganghwense TaxID=320778 RepID=UPI0040572F7E